MGSILAKVMGFNVLGGDRAVLRYLYARLPSFVRRRSLQGEYKVVEEANDLAAQVRSVDHAALLKREAGMYSLPMALN